uniref:Uncharacterized protein n=1 Tax=Talaromyces marneffei PM1 TaxID=1077442 RepID=A0A093Y263_TALMA
MSGTGEDQATSNDGSLETAMDILRHLNPDLLLSKFCVGDCTSDPQNDTRLSCTQPYQLLFYVCENCPTRTTNIKVAATLLEENKSSLDYELCRKIYMLPAHASEPVDCTRPLRWILDPSGRLKDRLYGSVTGTRIEIKVCPVEELRLALSFFYMYTKETNPNVLVFRGYLKDETNGCDGNGEAKSNAVGGGGWVDGLRVENLHASVLYNSPTIYASSWCMMQPKFKSSGQKNYPATTMHSIQVKTEFKVSTCNGKPKGPRYSVQCKTSNTNYYRKRMILARIRTLYDTLTRERTVQMHASNFDDANPKARNYRRATAISSFWVQKAEFGSAEWIDRGHNLHLRACTSLKLGNSLYICFIMGQKSVPEFNLESFQSALKSFKRAFQEVGQATLESTAKLEQCADAVDGALGKQPYIAQLQGIADIIVIEEFISNLEAKGDKTDEEIDLYESIPTIITNLDIAYAVIQHGVKEKWVVQSEEGFIRLYTPERDLVRLFYTNDDDDDPGKMNWMKEIDLAHISLTISYLQPMVMYFIASAIVDCLYFTLA